VRIYQNSSKKKTKRLLAALAASLNSPVPVIPTCTISKTRYVAGIQCPKRLYLEMRAPELGVVNEQAQAVMAQGTEVGALGRKVFPGGVQVPFGWEHLSEAIRCTRELTNNPGVPAVFEAAFEHHGVVVRIDVLRRGDAAFDLIEVKSSTEIKPYHIQDVSIQQYVAKGCGINVGRAFVMHLNRAYVYNGTQDQNANRLYSPSELFVLSEIQPLSSAVISRQLNDYFAMLSKKEPPQVAPGEQCVKPYECEFYRVCNRAWPVDDVRSLPIARWKIEGLVERGYQDLDQLPDSFRLRALYHLTARECMIATTAKERTVRIGTGLASELATLSYPVCYLDFETHWPALPWFAGMQPYDHIPFQWSLHRREHQNAPLVHSEFLWENHDDPRAAFASSLCAAIAGTNTVVVYNKGFESSRLKELGKWLPAYHNVLSETRRKLWDLLPVIRRNVYHPDFCGAYSLKKVLPALMPGMRYEDLSVSDGFQAGRTWLSLLSESNPAEKARLREGLLTYCAQDTAALACIVQVLAQLSPSHDRTPLPVRHIENCSKYQM
jgi:hypothetical protein